MCCCWPWSSRETRSTARDPDLETGDKPDLETRKKSEHDDNVSQDDEDAISADDNYSMKTDDTNIVMGTLGHLVGPDSARNSTTHIASGQQAMTDEFHTTFACAQLLGGDKITLVDFPDKAVALVRQAIAVHWSKGIQAEEAGEERALTLRLKGQPWHSCTVEEIIKSRRLSKGIIHSLYDAGWVLSLASSISLNDKDALVFRHQDPPPTRCDWMSVAFVSSGSPQRVDLIDAPPDAVVVVAEALQHLTRKHSAISGDQVVEFELRDTPLNPTNKKAMAPLLMLTILPALEKCGFTVAVALSQFDNNGKPDTWHCCRQVNWTPGLPVFHK